MLELPEMEHVELCYTEMRAANENHKDECHFEN
jgi:hypothetical protein